VSFPHAVFTQTVCASFAATTPKVQQSKRSESPHELPGLLPLNSPDLNPIYGIIEQRSYQTKVQEVSDLMQHLINVWASVEHSITDDTMDFLPLNHRTF